MLLTNALYLLSSYTKKMVKLHVYRLITHGHSRLKVNKKTATVVQVIVNSLAQVNKIEGA